jgi:hypothetical protein
MKIKYFFLIFFILVSSNINAQADYLIINENIRLPKDSIERKGLIDNLNMFLSSVKDNDSYENWILPNEKDKTQILITEIQDFMLKDTIGFKPYLINFELLGDKKVYSIQIAYISLLENYQPLLKAIFEFIVHKYNDTFLFSSPLSENTKEWKTRRFENLIFHYQNHIAESVIDQYIKIVPDYDKKLGIRKTTEYFFCDDCQDLASLLRLVGIYYKIDYNGLSWPMTDFDTEGRKVALYNRSMSRKEFVDPHDTFHGRANLAVPKNIQNYYMVCGCAYIYGGTWSGDWKIDWAGIQKRFKETSFNDKKTDWLKLYFERYNFGESKERPILITQFINALIIQKVEKEQGYSAVMKLFSSGNMYQDKDHFFKILEEVIGINEKNFNEKIRKLIESSLK